MEESHLNSGVQELISSYMLQDGLDLVADFEKSRGAYLYDTKRGDYFLDFLAFYSTAPVGYNHPRLVNFRAGRAGRVGPGDLRRRPDRDRVHLGQPGGLGDGAGGAAADHLRRHG